MSIHQLDFNGKDKVEKAIMRLQAYEPEEGYFLCFSGGKDSCVIKALADMAGVKYDAHYSVASVDPPELVRFIKDNHPDVIFDIPHDKNGKPVKKAIVYTKEEHGIPKNKIDFDDGNIDEYLEYLKNNSISDEEKENIRILFIIN